MNPERFERLRALSPVEAVQAWLNGAFGIGDEPALLEAIRRDSRISLSDKLITNMICEAMHRELDASHCLEKLVQASVEAYQVVPPDRRNV